MTLNTNYRKYWENYYKKNKAPSKPSPFAKFIKEKYLKPGNSLIEFGCGNGRDAIYFAENKAKVVAIDQCLKEIEYLNSMNTKNNLIFKCSDFTNLPENKNAYDIVYSRFTMHSITEKQEDKVLFWINKCLKNSGFFCIEVRGILNEIYKKGDPVKNQLNAFIYNNHYRRFLDLEKFCIKLKKMNFSTKLAVEDKGFSPYNGVDETFIRVVVQKDRF